MIPLARELTAKEVADRLGWSTTRVYQVAGTERLPIAREEPYGKSRKRRWFLESDVEALELKLQSGAS